MNQPPLVPRVLVAPLDWGLGHATRCIPVIRQLLQHRCQVILAASGRGKTLLQQEFPALPMLHLPGYAIEYAATGWGLAFKIVAQIPRLLAAIKKEQRWLQKVVADEGIDAVIADNRYGLHHSRIPCVFITHQLAIQTPFGLGEGVLQKLNYRYINQFSACWVPDSEGEGSLAGALSHPVKKPAPPLHYTGPLTRFQHPTHTTDGKHLLVLLSGPEPQRTLLEEKMASELKDYTKPVVLVRGLPGERELPFWGDNIIVYNHLPAAELETLVVGASLVISRCGYSTVMDLAALQKKSILIPTPGQTEQEYLATHLMQNNFALCIEQKKYRLKPVLSLAENFPFRYPTFAENNLARIVREFVEDLKKTNL